jgi:hypothetical protein
MPFQTQCGATQSLRQRKGVIFWQFFCRLTTSFAGLFVKLRVNKEFAYFFCSGARLTSLSSRRRPAAIEFLPVPQNRSSVFSCGFP